MIGGHDIMFPTHAPAEIMESAIRLATISWPEAVVENAETGELLGLDFIGVRELPSEALVYKNAAARQSWAEQGAVAENSNTMIHILRGQQSLTLVVDDAKSAEMRSFLDTVREYVFQDILCIRADAA